MNIFFGRKSLLVKDFLLSEWIDHFTPMNKIKVQVLCYYFYSWCVDLRNLRSCVSEIKLCEAKNYRDFILKCYWMLTLKSEWWMIIIECSQQAAEWKEWHKAQTCIKVNVITKYIRSRIYMHYRYCVKLPYTVKPY